METVNLSKFSAIVPKKISTEIPHNLKLSQDQLDYYDEHGYLVISSLVDFETLYLCKQRFINVCKGRVDRGTMTVMKELSLINSGAKGEDLINKVQDIVYDDVFSSYTEYPRLLDVLSQFIGSNITAVHSMLINKPPGTSRHPPHQDLHYFPFRPAEKIIATWTAIDEARLDNGCLYVLPGSHKRDTLYEHGYPPAVNGVVNKLYHGIVKEDEVAPMDQRIHLEMLPGDTVFFHPLLVHGSGPNVSKQYRKAISCHYASSECKYIETKGTVQEDIAKEIEAVARRRGIDVPFVDIWRYRSKLVKGVKCNL